MSEKVHSYLRRRGATPDEPVELHYLATGRHLQDDVRALGQHQLPRPDLLRGVLRAGSLAQASRIVGLKLNGLYTREVEVPEGDTFYADHPEFVGPPRIQLKQPRPPRPGSTAAPKE